MSNFQMNNHFFKFTASQSQQQILKHNQYLLIDPMAKGTPRLPHQQQAMTRVGPGADVFRTPTVQMNWFKNAFSNEDFETKENAGLSKIPDKITATNADTGKTVKVIPNQKLPQAARALGLNVSYNCQNGECGTCVQLVDNKPTKICVARVPNKDFTMA